jgi:hypothetical protein
MSFLPMTVVASLLLGPPFSMQADNARVLEVIDFHIAWLADEAGPEQEYVFVLGGVAFRTVDGLKRFVSHLKRGTTLRWNQSCIWMGGEPLSTQEEIEEFRKHCERAGVSFQIVGGG